MPLGVAAGSVARAPTTLAMLRSTYRGCHRRRGAGLAWDAVLRQERDLLAKAAAFFAKRTTGEPLAVHRV